MQLAPSEPFLAATVHHQNTAGLARLGLVFTVAYDPARHGEPVNAEPHKCAKIEWFPTHMLPHNIYPYTAIRMQLYRRGVPFGLSSWHQHPGATDPSESPAPTA